jgi:hypothetical protein
MEKLIDVLGDSSNLYISDIIIEEGKTAIVVNIKDKTTIKQNKTLEHFRDSGNIFEVLDKRGVTYSVCAGFSELGLKSWFIVAKVSDFNKSSYRPLNPLFKLGFRVFEPRKDVVERDLSESEVSKFFAIKEKFHVVEEGQHGTVYELKDRSLKNELKSVSARDV